jgi:hypothetical protein
LAEARNRFSAVVRFSDALRLFAEDHLVNQTPIRFDNQQRSKPWEPFHKLTRDAIAPMITVDYTIDFGRVLHDANPDAAFAFLSGSGADPSPSPYGRLGFVGMRGTD